MLHDLMATTDLSDVTLVSDDNIQIKAHKFVLSYASPVFKNIMANLSDNAMIYLRGTKHQEIKAVLEFLYVGQASLQPDKVDDFFKVASDLQIESLWHTNQEKNCTDTKTNKEKVLRDVKDEELNVETVLDHQEVSPPIIIRPTKEDQGSDRDLDPLEEEEE